ncbi:MAG: ABC transporter ATP-binding protein, partial [Chitinophagia bacterium]|nr:ABC transporter ATP-binding protein [Chitinophagia bacterium]
MKAPLLQVRDLWVSFPGAGPDRRNAVEGISFDMARNRITAIVGESGSGKSLTALCINRLTPPEAHLEGSILFTPDESQPGTDLLRLPEKTLEGIRGMSLSMVFQEPMTSLNPMMACGEQVSEMLRHHLKASREEAHQATLDLFRKVHLPSPAEVYRKYPHQLSGGQRQRVMIAMAVSCRPDLLIADEPTTALDVTVQKTILGLLRELQRESGMGVLFITHDLGIVDELADEVVVMHRGRILEQGPVEQVLHSPSHPYTQALLACRPARHRPGERLPWVGDYTDMVPQEPIPPPAPRNAVDRTTPDGNPPPLLEVRDLVVCHPGTGRGQLRRAVDGVSFDVAQGEMLGLVGESGCGKTTLGRALLRLIPTEAGSIRFRGREITEMPERAFRSLRQELQIVFQDPYGSLNPRLTIGSMLMEPLRTHRRLSDDRARRERAANLLARVGLGPEILDRYPHEFSGGQRQRIGIARALVLDPAFLVLDESVSALDVSIQAQVLNLLADLRRDLGFTAIFISHDLSV